MSTLSFRNLSRLCTELEKVIIPQDILTSEDELIRAKCEGSLYEFIKVMWSSLYPGFDYVDGWHIKTICAHLEEAYRGKITRLIINIPSRCMK